ncbi:MAG TPA: hypothetical protein GXX19_09235 [Syntrophomonadaceae bacterium]|nr:hypothetical protein [Syntrophomonadaceae bacterium]
MRLLIDQVWGRIGIKQANPLLQLYISDPRLKLSIKPPVLTVAQDRVELSIDATACRADVNQYDPIEFIRVCAARARGVVEEAIARIAEEGDVVAAVENGNPDAIADLARENGLDREVDVELVPGHLPDIDFRIVKGSRDFKEGRVAVELVPGNVKVDLREGTVRIYFRQPPELHIYAVGSQIDLHG